MFTMLTVTVKQNHGYNTNHVIKLLPYSNAIHILHINAEVKQQVV